MEPSQRSFSVFLGKQVLHFNWTTLCPCKSELHIFKNLVYVSTSQSSNLHIFFWNKCSFSLQMLVHQWKLLLCGLCHTHWKHWERWGRYWFKLFWFIFDMKVLFSLSKLWSSIFICLRAGSPWIQRVFWWHSGCCIVTFYGPCKLSHILFWYSQHEFFSSISFLCSIYPFF